MIIVIYIYANITDYYIILLNKIQLSDNLLYEHYSIPLKFDFLTSPIHSLFLIFDEMRIMFTLHSSDKYG